jgi:hypothetical protein
MGATQRKTDRPLSRAVPALRPWNGETLRADGRPNAFPETVHIRR